jgi:translocation and assembly module TamA
MTRKRITRQGLVRRRLASLLLAAGGSLLAVAPANAFDIFGLFGSETPPVARRDAVPYVLTIDGLSDNATAETALKDASTLESLRTEPPTDGEELALRVEADLPRLVDALWGQGYYAARVAIAIDGATATIEQSDLSGLARAAERYRAVAPVPVRITVDPGPLYRFSNVSVIEQRSRQPLGAPIIPDRLLPIKPGDPAATSNVLGAAAVLADRFREDGRPFVNVGRQPPVIDHPATSVDLTLTVDPGPRTPIGDVLIAGEQDVDESVIRSFVYAEKGDPYSPAAIAAIRRSVSRIEALGGVRVREGEAPAADGTLPLTVEVTERPKRVFGGTLGFSTTDGPTINAYWAHRNLFGGAERLRFEFDLAYPILDRDESRDFFDEERLTGRVSASFLKPALMGSRFDVLADAFAQRERTESYDADVANLSMAIRRRFSDSIFVQGGIEAEIGSVETAPDLAVQRTFDYGLIGLPFSASYDTTDSPLDPTEGIRLTATAGPYFGFGDAPDVFGYARVQGSAYWAFDEDARYILAGRAVIGSIFGGESGDIPPGRLFFAGGGGSVRGYAYRSLSPLDANGEATGGRSLFEASLEARIKVTDTIGIVPFVDVGQAFESSYPDFADLRIAAGIGLRYYTAIGPIRIDVAFPLDRRSGEEAYALYVSIGQAF